MNKNKLKEMVKNYFNLTERKFGEVRDINDAFTLVFEGDTLEVGKRVTVRTDEGQEMEAPDGVHELLGGITIRTEDSIVTEIQTQMIEQETPPALEGDNIVEVDPHAVPDTVPHAMMEEGEKVEDTLTFPQIAEAIAEVIKSEMEFVKKEMAEMKSKMEKMSAEPAVEKTLPKKTFSIDTKSVDAVDPKRYAMMKEIMKNKRISTPVN